MKYMIVYYSWGGLTQKRTVHQYLFGYTDDIISMLKYLDP